jgi:superfamily I DNA/RNA helicase
VDKYQDTNLIQYLWLRLLAQSHQTFAPGKRCGGDGVD